MYNLTMKESENIFIYGVPGVGKTHLSMELGKKLGLSVYEGDKIKSGLRKIVSKKESPFLYLGTCKAYKQFGELNRENVIHGLLAVREALRVAVLEKGKGHKIILEGAFLDPGILKELGRPILVTTSDEEIHKKQFLSHREKLLDFAGNEFKAARIIQSYLIDEATKLKIQIIENNGSSDVIKSF